MLTVNHHRKYVTNNGILIVPVKKSILAYSWYVRANYSVKSSVPDLTLGNWDLLMIDWLKAEPALSVYLTIKATI